ncbi:hypothetical protein [Streptomyces hundungensis]|uniref:hypothetical protein n=1 Tax=Streptomyces hundungensis TaxID=1077946 RepID=UPI001C1F9708|nr:hypothetical protein [Streptomyces hundungensis]
MTLELTEAAAIKCGDSELAVTAGQRAAAAAERPGDPVIMASADRHLADAMTAHGEAAAAVAFVTAAANRLQRDLVQREPEGLPVLGMLFLKAAMAQAAAEPTTTARTRSPARGRASSIRPVSTRHSSTVTRTSCGRHSGRPTARSTGSHPMFSCARAPIPWQLPTTFRPSPSQASRASGEHTCSRTAPG